jgi:alpha,alpha-trehalase
VCVCFTPWNGKSRLCGLIQIPTYYMNTHRVINSLRSSGLVCEFGVSTSSVASKEQWDYPNMWPPLIEMLVEGLDSCEESPPMPVEELTNDDKSCSGKILAFEIAQLYVSTAFNHYMELSGSTQSHFMCEKYNAIESGGGGGGEYEPQVGFGWSNGTALVFLKKYGQVLRT